MFSIQPNLHSMKKIIFFHQFNNYIAVTFLHLITLTQKLPIKEVYAEYPQHCKTIRRPPGVG